MTFSTMILAATLVLSGFQDAPASVSAEVEQSAAAPAVEPEKAEKFDLARLKFDQCQGERFDFQASEQTRVGLCGKAGASRDEIATMLESAIRQLESTDRIRPESRERIVAQIRAKLVEVRAR